MEPEKICDLALELLTARREHARAMTSLDEATEAMNKAARRDNNAHEAMRKAIAFQDKALVAHGHVFAPTHQGLALQVFEVMP